MPTRGLKVQKNKTLAFAFNAYGKGAFLETDHKLQLQPYCTYKVITSSQDLFSERLRSAEFMQSEFVR